MNAIGEIRLFPYENVPEGFLVCKGQLLEIQTYPKLYMLIGNKYGKSDAEHFYLPDLNHKADNAFSYCMAVAGKIPVLSI